MSSRNVFEDNHMQDARRGTSTDEQIQTVVNNALERASAAQQYNALRNQRTVLSDQLQGLTRQRQDLARQLAQSSTPVSRSGLEGRIAGLDQRIVSLDQQMAEVEKAIATAAGVPGVVQQPRVVTNTSSDAEEAVGVGFAVALVILSVAIARRLWRRGGTATAVPKELSDRISRIEQGVDTIALEIERIGEGQRFLTRLQSENAEQRALGSSSQTRR